MQPSKALGMIDRLTASYKFNKLPDDLSANVREWYLNDISKDIDIDNLDNYIVYNKEEIPIISKIDRIVIGDYGPYIEFDSINANMDVIYEDPKEAYRSTDKYIDKVKYLWYTSTGKDKIYLQLRTVEYADYLIGKFYISPYDVVIKKKKGK